MTANQSFDVFGFLETGIKSVYRIGQTMAVFSESALSWLSSRDLPAPRLLRQTFEKLGATYIKLGQFVASAPSLFPAEYVLEFQNCLDRTDPLPWSTIKNILEKEFKKPLGDVFQKINPEPLASASIAQVHAARLCTGEDVVLKIQKPGVSDILLTDLNFLYFSARLIELISPELSRASLSAIVEEIQSTMLAECDFLKEARHLEEFNAFLEKSGIGIACAPRVYHQHTTPRVITMERLHGAPFTDLESIKKNSKNPEETLIQALNTWFTSLLFCDFFHADLHAGNLLVLTDGRIGFIDFGIVGRIQKETWEGLFTLMESIAHNRFQDMARALTRIGATEKEVNTDQLARDLEALFKSMSRFMPEELERRGVNEQDINRLLVDLVEVGNNHGIRFPREFALLIKQFLYFDRYVQMLAPDLDIFADGRLRPGIAALEIRQQH